MSEKSETAATAGAGYDYPTTLTFTDPSTGSVIDVVVSGAEISSVTVSNQGSKTREKSDTMHDPFNCPTCGSHYYGLFASMMLPCVHCLQRELTAALTANAELTRKLEGARAAMQEAQRDSVRIDAILDCDFSINKDTGGCWLIETDYATGSGDRQEIILFRGKGRIRDAIDTAIAASREGK